MRRRWFAAVVFLAAAVLGRAATRMVIVGGSYGDLADFEQFATRAKQSGATHVRISDSLPWSAWQYDTPGDPYPSWVISNAGLLKIAIPSALKKYIPSEHSERVLGLLEARAKILRALGLKAAFSCFDPSMLPEGVFADHPRWRGARVDHPARSRVPRWSPSIDHPEVRALYQEAIGLLLKRCPEIELLSITTNDSGVGLDWSTGTYAGQLGNTAYRSRSMEERLRGFFAALQAGAKAAGGSLEVNIRWTREKDPRRMATKLSAGFAIENFEGPDGTPFQATAGFEEGYFSPYHPVAGIPQPMRVLDGLADAAHSRAPRLVLNFGDRFHRELYFEIYDRFRAAERKPATLLDRLEFLRELAVTRVGEAKAHDLLQLWTNVRESTPYMEAMMTGGYITDIGVVHQRWLTRPFVPFPAELKSEEKEYFRKFQFQARSEADADNLADIQSMVWSGWAARLFVGKLTGPLLRLTRESASLARKLGDPTQARRFEVFVCFVNTVNHAISYQAQLDRARAKPVFANDPVAPSSNTIGWDQQLMMETARAEIDNVATLIDLLGANPGEYLNLAPTKAEEDIRRLPPDVVDQLRRKLAIMNAHWEDYERLFLGAKP